jgi:acetylornithine aminotransferase
VLKDGLEKELAGVAGVVEVRGQGLMIGIELNRPCAPLLGRSAEAGLMISVTAERVVRLLPALIMTAEEARQVVAILCPLIEDFLSAKPA